MRYRFFSTVAFLSIVSANFNPGIIPDYHTEFPIFTLTDTGVIHQDLIEKFVKASSPNATFSNDHKTGARLGYDGDRLVSLADPASGETKIFPNLAYLPPFHAHKCKFDNVHKLLGDNGIFPKDDTTLEVFPGSTLLGSTVQRQDGIAEQHRAYLKHAVVQRNITAGGSAYPTCGPGSSASFGIGAGDQIYSVSYLWKRAINTSGKLKPVSRKDAYKIILQEIEKFEKSDSIVIDGVDICFYDSGKKYIQPVYRYWGRLYQNSPDILTPSPPGFTGYVSINPNQSPEPIPSLGDRPSGSTPPSDIKPTSNNSLVRSIDPDPELVKRRPALNVGRYINRNDTDQWWINSNNFLMDLRTGSVADFIDKQYYWAYPWEYTTQKNSYVNSVHIAESEQHGLWHEFVTNSNCCDRVKLSDIPEDGYGPGANGSLAYWIIHSCEVIPSPADFDPADFRKAFDPWWHIFNGLHAVLGYRTSMWIGDGVMPTFGKYIGLGAPVVFSWLQIVHDDTAHYKKDGMDYLYKTRGIYLPMGRASAMAVCGHEGDTVVNVENIGRPQCLIQFWYDN